MKRSTRFLFAGAVACAASTLALGADWFEDFESYACDADICAADGTGGWVFWTGADSSYHGRVSCASDGYPVYEGEKSLRALGDGTPGVPGPNADDLVHTYSFINTGYWLYTAWQYIPSTLEGDGTAHYFILLNQWEANGGGSTNWSTQLEENPTRGVIESEFENVTLPLTTDEWVQIRVYINLFETGLGANQQNVFYGNQLLVSKSWTEGVSGGGTLTIQAVDLWFNDVTADYVYYDDMSLVQLPETGACCFNDGTCQDDTLVDECQDDLGGRFQGIGSLCDVVVCPEYGDCGWELTGPTSFYWTTVGQGDDCDWVAGSEDEQFTIDIPFTGEWDFSFCEGTEWDTVITLGSSCCGFDFGIDDNGCPTGFQSLLHFASLPAGTYYLNLEDVDGQNGGFYTLVVDTPCILDCPDGAYVELEPCGDDTNGGCNMEGTPQFEPITLDVPICGKVWFDGSTRDTDWYEYIASGAEDLTFSGTAEFLCVIGLVQYAEGSEGSGNCDDTTNYISPFTQIHECQEAEIDVSLPNAGTYWFFVAPDFNNDVILCGDEDALENDYVVMLSAGGAECPWDFDGDGDVDTGDLLHLLGCWGQACGDVDGDGDTDTADLLDLLAHWGDCP
jgi:hypothetical protein